MPIPHKYLNVIMKMPTANSGADKKQAFVYRGLVITEETEINETNVLEYEFINLGVFHVIINNNIVVAGCLPAGPILENYGFIDKWKTDVKQNEKDNTVYKIKFSELPHLP